jgi:hypothetical protein
VEHDTGHATILAAAKSRGPARPPPRRRRAFKLCAAPQRLSPCSREVEALQALGDALRAPALGPADADELHVRRERTRLLAAFDAALAPRERSYGARSVFLGIAAVAALIVGLFVYFRPRAVETGVEVADAVVVHADSNASWSRRVDGSLENPQGFRRAELGTLLSLKPLQWLLRFGSAAP